MASTLSLHVDPRGVATLMLDRPERHNALDAGLVTALHASLAAIADDPGIRAVVLAGAGSSFCSGADLDHMRRMSVAGDEENVRDALDLAACLRSLAELDRPVLARVHGNVFGGGIGLLCCADIVIAASETRFCLSEVRLGLAPAVIAPFVMASIGRRQMGRLALTAARIDAAQALDLGLIHRHVAAQDLDTATEEELSLLLQGAPLAQRTAKRLLRELAGPTPDAFEEHAANCATVLARLRSADEAREGLQAFLDKRRPGWST